jgi:hypothetical protein
MRNSKDHQLLTSWLAVIGMLTMYWSPVERCIDQCVHLLHIRSASSKNKPTKLNQKMEYISKNIPSDIALTEAIEELIKITKTAVQIRDVCVHGVLESWNESEIVIGKVKGFNKDHVIEMFIIDRKRLENSARSLTLIQDKWSAIVKKLL